MPVALVTVLVTAVLVIGFLYVSRKDTSDNIAPQLPESVLPGDPIPDNPKKPEPKTFDPQTFYDLVQNGMDLTKLNQLAGKNGDCATTGAYPAPETYPCYWSDNKYIVRVTIGGQGVTSKSIHPNNPDQMN